MFYSEEDRRAGLPLQLLETARREGRVSSTGWRHRKDGTRFWGDVVITALHTDDGQLTGFAKVTRDLTAHKDLETAQARFLGTIAHDFRTPIAAMKAVHGADARCARRDARGASCTASTRTPTG